ncbi:MAG: tetratricopeptide repeat protein [Burkholderiales bacterium]|nr:tetratricopeptide repeat protein [Burkholderiales bacterium]
MKILSLFSHISCSTLGALALCTPLSAFSTDAPPASAQHQINRCNELATCITSILDNAKEVDLRPTFEAMQKMKTMLRADYVQSQRAKAAKFAGAKQTPATPSTEEALRHAILLSDHPSRLYKQLGELMLQQNNATAAEHAFQQMLKYTPTDSHAWQGLAESLMAQDKLQAAVSALVVAYEWADNKPTWKAQYLARRHPLYRAALDAVNERAIAVLEQTQEVRARGVQKLKDLGIRAEILQNPELRCGPPEYPAEALRKSQVGTVQLRFIFLYFKIFQNLNSQFPLFK